MSKCLAVGISGSLLVEARSHQRAGACGPSPRELAKAVGMGILCLPTHPLLVASHKLRPDRPETAVAERFSDEPTFQ